MRILVDSPGQTCNRLWSYLDSVAWAIVNNSKVQILFWDPSIKEFDSLRSCPYVNFPFYSKRIIDRIGDGRYLQILYYIFANPCLRFFYRTQFAQKLGFLQSWDLREENEYYPRVLPQIKDIFRPNKEITTQVQSVFDHYRREGFFIVGVHVRRGDYKSFLNGKYFFDWSFYRLIMHQIEQILKSKKVCFFIATNENIDSSLHDNFVIVDTDYHTSIHDLYGLCSCDLIVGPPSTFSVWASFYGNVPLCLLERETEISDLDQFKIMKGFFIN